jgi:hypothetical protein
LRGRHAAILTLGSCGPDMPLAMVECLTRILATTGRADRGRVCAAAALGKLGPPARSAQGALEVARRDDSDLGLAAAWALMEISR